MCLQTGLWRRLLLVRSVEAVDMTLISKLYSISLLLLAVVTGVALVASAVDIILQSLNVHRADEYLFIGICYVVLALASAVIAFARFIKVRILMSKIPNVQIPIAKVDLSGGMFKLIHTELDRSSMIALSAQPTEENLPGFKGKQRIATTLVRSLNVIETCASDLGMPRHQDMSARSFILYLTDAGYVDSDLADRYLRLYEQARFGDAQQMTEFQYKAGLKMATLVVREMQQRATPPQIDQEHGYSYYD